MSRRLAAALLAAVLGLAVGAALGLTREGHYEASTLLEVLPPAEDGLSPAEETAADVQAATYAQLVGTRGFLEQVRAQVAAGQLTVEELADRVEGRHAPGTALVEVVGEGPTVEEARGLSVELSAALIGAVQQAAQSRATQVADALRQQIAELDSQIAQAEADEVASLREQRDRLGERLADVTAAGVEAGNRLRLAAVPAPDAKHVTPRTWLWILAGGVAGLLLGSLLPGVPRPRLRVPRPRMPSVRLPERAPRQAAAAPVLLAPAAGELLRGTFPLLTDPAGADAFWSRDGLRWHRLRGDLDTTQLADGEYLLRTRGSRESVPVVIDNNPPQVTLGQPVFRNGLVLLSAEASDDGTGVASLTFMVSTGGPEWSAIPEAWVPPTAGVYWFCAVAADQAGNQATSELAPLRVG